jgi:hypothetical protein
MRAGFIREEMPMKPLAIMLTPAILALGSLTASATELLGTLGFAGEWELQSRFKRSRDRGSVLLFFPGNTP